MFHLSLCLSLSLSLSLSLPSVKHDKQTERCVWCGVGDGKVAKFWREKYESVGAKPEKGVE